ncbi:hypothetical protein TBLA_0F03230 [Henningerozyma blattae CBS 6284]|uniref:Amino acid transporter transmembrane domain-containing protein n=1 Tax=Henningerozyma blattae (strain ATCC 34711 / CBS 6284 / DSM 70876 / NBRC 10599 / NRRL Y-10934 / UCD 77-7) TaxID=1071380 RepID=I2H659_HENB6|nr:hypothetical protein TBLA_0F03230 [Tetrapisispora blattae CBS 6284]CCH61861.1 hypothetical protein TBLA_0F03230 [Tetrapisispora blattae CBS 6284]
MGKFDVMTDNFDKSNPFLGYDLTEYSRESTVVTNNIQTSNTDASKENHSPLASPSKEQYQLQTHTLRNETYDTRTTTYTNSRNNSITDVDASLLARQNMIVNADEDEDDEEESYTAFILEENSPAAKKEGTSNSKVFFILLKSFVGTGVLFLPSAFQSGGLLFSNLLLLFFGIYSFWCYYILTLAKKVTNVNNFENIGSYLYGNWLKFIIVVSVVLSQLGFAGTYVIFTAENIKLVLEHVCNVKNLPIEILIFSQLIIFIPLSFLRKISKLAIPTLIANVLTLVGLILVVVLLLQHLISQGKINNGIGPDVIFYFNSSQWTTFVGIAIFSFEGVGLIIPVEDSMRNPEKFPLVLSLVLLVCTAIFMLIGTLGYLTFGKDITPVILSSFNQKNKFVSIAQLCYSIAILLSTPIQLFPVYKMVEEAIFKKNKNNTAISSTSSEPQDNDNEENKAMLTEKIILSGRDSNKIKWLKNLSRTTIVLLVTIISYFGSQDLSKFVAIVGSVACIPLIYIYPPFFHLKTHSLPNSLNLKFKWRVIIDITLLIFGLLAVLYTSYQSIFNS